MKRIRTAVVGCVAGVCRSEHLPALAEHPQVKLSVLCDIDVAKGTELANQYEAEFCSDYKELLGRADIDLVDICTCDYCHAEQTLDALRAGKSVLCEKPIATTWARAQDVCHAARQAKGKYMCIANNRWRPRFAKTKAVIDSGRIGDPIFISQTLTAPGSRPTDHYSSKMHPLIHNGMHWFDLANWLLDDVPVRVYANYIGAENQWAGSFYIDATFHYSKGPILHFVENRSVQAGHPFFWGLNVIGTGGEIEAGDRENFSVSIHTAEGIRLAPHTFELLCDDDHCHRLQINHFIDCLLQDREPDVSVEASMKAIEMSFAAIESIETGKSIALEG